MISISIHNEQWVEALIRLNIAINAQFGKVTLFVIIVDWTDSNADMPRGPAQWYKNH